ncbi:MAG: magnesium transporter [Bacteroidetes bacterium CG12_big_fil_rev_8_21_14_0_65_60_17]|nr:MAG: magnesium transporter [Bacteroidetes bacterium CG12_big_fil_rev_8_21_14_0_65_60_17]
MEQTDQNMSSRIDLDGELLDNLEALVEAGEEGMVLNIARDLHPADLADVLMHMDDDLASTLFHWLPDEDAGEVLAELDDDYRADLLEDTPHERIASMLDELDTDDAVDVLADLPQHLADQVIPGLEYAADVQELLGYDEETAGGRMATELVFVHETATVDEATEEVRLNAENVEFVYAIFVVDDNERLVGFVSLKRLLLSPAHVRIRDIMNEDVISVNTSVDQEDVARLMERYDLVSLPVVDHDGRLVGRITIDDIVDVIREEAEEDMQRMSGLGVGEEPTDSVLRIVRGRLPWLLTGMLGSAFAATVILYFESALVEATVLASFIPIVMATAGNAGIQSSSVAVQGLASGNVWASDFSSRIMKEMGVALLNGLAASVVLALAVLILSYITPIDGARVVRLAMTAGLALLIVVTIATTIGASVPLLLDRFDVDPALATGPFITASNDILGILIFFLLATWLYL